MKKETTVMIKCLACHFTYPKVTPFIIRGIRCVKCNSDYLHLDCEQSAEENEENEERIKDR